MATLLSSSHPPGRDAPFRVSTREVSLDFITVGADQSPNELGALSAPAFAALVEKFATIPAVKLIDGDPQLVVSAKRGRFILLPSSGKLLVRPANDPQQPYEKFLPADLAAFLDATDQPTQAQAPAKNFQTLIGSAATFVAESAPAAPPAAPAAPIYGSFPKLTVRPSSASGAAPALGSAPVTSAPQSAPAPKKISRGLVLSVAALFLLTAAASLWISFGPAPANQPLPAGPPPEFDLVKITDELTSLKKRFAGTYATSGDAGERILEVRADGTYHYQVFGEGVARTANRSGTYTVALRHATKKPVLQSSGLGTIEIRDEKNLFCQQILFTRVP